MFRNSSNQAEYASARSAAAFFTCANLSVILDAVLMASILFALAVLGLRTLLVLVVLISILRISLGKVNQPESLA